MSTEYPRSILLKIVKRHEDDGLYLEALNMLNALQSLPDDAKKEGDTYFFRSIEKRLFYKINKLYYDNNDNFQGNQSRISR